MLDLKTTREQRLRAALANLYAAVRAKDADPEDHDGTGMLLEEAMQEAGAVLNER